MIDQRRQDDSIKRGVDVVIGFDFQIECRLLFFWTTI